MNCSTTSESASNTTSSSIEICAKELDALLDSKENIKEEEPENVNNLSVSSSNGSGYRRSRLMSKRTFNQKRLQLSNSQASFLSTTTELSNTNKNTNNVEYEDNSVDIPSNTLSKRPDVSVPAWDGDQRTPETACKDKKTSMLNRKQSNSKDNKRGKTKRLQEWKAKKNYVRKADRSHEFMFPRLTFQRIVQEIMQGLQLQFRFQSLALAALQEAAEAYLSELFGTATWATSHCKRVTLQPSDIMLIKKIRKIRD